MPRRKQPAISDELLDQLLGGSDPRAALAEGSLLDGLKTALAERMLNAELDHHPESGEPDGRPNSRNGHGSQTVLTGTGKLELQIPRDRLSTFDPQLIAKDQRRFPGFDDKIVSMYARGMSTRAIQGHPRELYGIAVSPDLVSAVTDAVLDEVAEWQNRPLEALYPLEICRVEDGRGGIAPFPVPAHQTGRADFPHPAFRLASPQSPRR